MSTGPQLPSASTAPAGLPERAAAARTPAWQRRLLARLQARLQCGSLRVQLPNGDVHMARAGQPGPEASVVLHRWRALRRLVTGGDVGLAESYRDGDWSSPHLTDVLELGARHLQRWQRELAPSWPAALALKLLHRLRDNTRRGSRQNIAFHYDLGNDFYRPWLDPELIYSSAIYSHPAQTLEQAQADKLARIAQLLELPREAGAEVLEIGCGWGALACALAGQGARVRGITLSTEQLAHAKARVQQLGLQGQVALQLQDYRDTRGQFDRIVSIEMIEAVGERHWPGYFKTLRQRLKPGGVAVLQAITIDEAAFEGYRSTPDFIQRFIFPGGMLPTVQALQDQARQAGLQFEVCQRFGASYAQTLAEWRRRFHAAWPQIQALGFDEQFRRLWDYYLCYCEAGFRCGRVDVGLYRLRRPQQPG